jgi:hypothetical protein
MLKETSEFSKIITSLLNGGKRSLEDGKLDPLKDAANFIPTLLAAPDGIRDMGKMADEADAATIPDCEELDLEISSGLDAFGADRLRYDWTKALMGVHAIFRMGVSWGRKRGQEEGEKAVLQDIKDGKLSIEDIEKMEL